MSIQVINLKKGDATTLAATITSGLTSLIGYTAKMYITTQAGTAIKTYTGTVNGLVITYSIVNEDSKIFPLGSHKYEMKLFDSSDHVYTHHEGAFVVECPIEEDPS